MKQEAHTACCQI